MSGNTSEFISPSIRLAVSIQESGDAQSDVEVLGGNCSPKDMGMLIGALDRLRGEAVKSIAQGIITAAKNHGVDPLEAIQQFHLGYHSMLQGGEMARRELTVEGGGV